MVSKNYITRDFNIHDVVIVVMGFRIRIYNEGENSIMIITAGERRRDVIFKCDQNLLPSSAELNALGHTTVIVGTNGTVLKLIPCSNTTFSVFNMCFQNVEALVNFPDLQRENQMITIPNLLGNIDVKRFKTSTSFEMIVNEHRVKVRIRSGTADHSNYTNLCRLVPIIEEADNLQLLLLDVTGHFDGTSLHVFVDMSSRMVIHVPSTFYIRCKERISRILPHYRYWHPLKLLSESCYPQIAIGDRINWMERFHRGYLRDSYGVVHTASKEILLSDEEYLIYMNILGWNFKHACNIDSHCDPSFVELNDQETNIWIIFQFYQQMNPKFKISGNILAVYETVLDNSSRWENFKNIHVSLIPERKQDLCANMEFSIKLRDNVIVELSIDTVFGKFVYNMKTRTIRVPSFFKRELMEFFVNTIYQHQIESVYYNLHGFESDEVRIKTEKYLKSCDTSRIKSKTQHSEIIFDDIAFFDPIVSYTGVNLVINRPIKLFNPLIVTDLKVIWSKASQNFNLSEFARLQKLHLVEFPNVDEIIANSKLCDKFPRAITKLVLQDCMFTGDFLKNMIVEELELISLNRMSSENLKDFQKAVTNVKSSLPKRFQLTFEEATRLESETVVNDDTTSGKSTATIDIEHDPMKILALNSFFSGLLPFLPFLQQLTITKVPLTIVPQEVFMIKNVQICIITDTIVSCPWVTMTTQLHLQIQGVDHIPEWIANIKTIENLTIVGSNISRLEEQANIFEFSNIVILSLPNTLIERVPEYMYSTSLKLYCHSNVADVVRAFNSRAMKMSKKSENKLLQTIARIFGVQIDLNLSNIGEEDVTEICVWLERSRSLLDRNEYGNKQSILNIIKATLDNFENADFREFAMSNISANNVNCSDRSGMLLNILYSGYRTLCHSEELPLIDKVSLLLSASRTHALRISITEYFESHPNESGENVETYLLNEVAHSNKFKLLSCMSGMLYAPIGRKFDSDMVKPWIIDRVFETAVQFSFFDKIANSDPEYVENIENINDRFCEQLDNISADQNSSNQHASITDIHAKQQIAIENYKLQWLINTRVKLGDPVDRDNTLIPLPIKEKYHL